MPDPDPLAAELARLGRLMPDDVALDLWGRGVRGRRGTCHGCPLAGHLTAVAGEPVSVMVDGRHWAESSHRILPLPPSVSRFVRNFDGGQYPELEGGDGR
jgi:hypothetical protein